MLVYGIPLYYTYKSRLKTNLDKIAYIFTFLVPVILNGLLNIKNMSSIYYSIFFFFSILLCMEIYEIGYILNDVISIKKEKNPTLRLSRPETKYIQNNIKKILVLKLMSSFFLYIFINIFIKISVFKYFIVLLTILGVYYIHNNFRSNKVTYLTFFLLSILRFFTPVYLLANNKDESLYLLVTTVLLFAFIRNIEEIGHKKYFIGNLNIYKIRNGFRVIYFSIMLLLVIILENLNCSYNLKNIKILLCYLLVYRLSIYILLKIKGRKK